MFGIGLPEMLLIMALALIVVGPDKLPDLARSLARGLMDLKKAAAELKDSLDKEGNPLADIRPELEAAAKDLQNSILKDANDKAAVDSSTGPGPESSAGNAADEAYQELLRHNPAANPARVSTDDSASDSAGDSAGDSVSDSVSDSTGTPPSGGDQPAGEAAPPTTGPAGQEAAEAETVIEDFPEPAPAEATTEPHAAEATSAPQAAQATSAPQAAQAAEATKEQQAAEMARNEEKG